MNKGRPCPVGKTPNPRKFGDNITRWYDAELENFMSELRVGYSLACAKRVMVTVQLRSVGYWHCRTANHYLHIRPTH